MKQEIELSKIELITRIEELKKKIDKLRPLSNEIEDRIFQKFRLDWNYHSNAIEGNTLNYGETYAFLMHGVTAKGKPLKDYLDIKGHNDAINFLLNFIHDKEELTEAAIRELHKTILSEPYEIDAMTSNGKLTKKKVELGVYKKTPNHVLTSTGEMHYFATPEETPAKMYDLIEWFRELKENKEIHPVIISAIFHHKFTVIHPFDDGNGRIARLLMNLILMQYHLPPAIIKKEDRGNYYLALSQADVGIYQPFVEYICERVIHSLEIYFKGARGESIEENDDVDKEVILLKKEIDGNPSRIEVKLSQTVKEQFLLFHFPILLEHLTKDLSHFKSLFLNFATYFVASPPQLKEYIEPITGYKNIHQPMEKILSLFRDEVNFNFILAFNDFKNVDNPFNVYINIHLLFENYSFTIAYLISGIFMIPKTSLLDTNGIKLSNYYHIGIDEIQMKEFNNAIKKDLLYYIKSKK